ncbi:unnamed protein product [Linum trigynum]|uniref:Reverse transcriptase domain-containing protein n=1 Tax=Linum trigynum TaxID=586398 RepID=A0AAV2FGK7_9ROSI
MAEQNSNIPSEVTPIKAMTDPRVFAGLAEASNRDAVLIEEEEPELTAKEMRQQMAKQNDVIASMQKQMSQVMALMMSREAAAAPSAPPDALQLTQGGTSGHVTPPHQTVVELAAPETQRYEPPGRADLSFLEQHLSPQFRPNPPKKALHQPLCAEIMAEHLSGAPPTLPTYNGTTDPEDHVSTFCLRMQLQTNSNAALCRTFPSTFSGICLDWYNRLPNGIIRSFEEFILLFTTKFASQKRRPLHLKALIDIRQKDGESLQAFYARWSRVAMAVRDLTPETAAHHLMDATTSMELKRALAKRPITLSTELEVKVEKAITLEKTLGAGSIRRFEPAKMQKEEQARRQLPVPRDQLLQAHSGARRPPPPPEQAHRGRSPERRPSNYTPLNDTVKNIYHVLREKGYKINWPAPMKTLPHMRDPKKHCEFHRDTGHWTENCRELHYEIEGLIQRGLLSEFIRGAEEPAERPVEPPPPPQADYDDASGSYVVRKEIGVVTVEGDRPKKKTKRDRAIECAAAVATQKCNLSFDDAELPGGVPSEDPLIITALVAACNVRRLLIDGGSAADILFKSTVDQMDIDPRLIKPAYGNLVGFSGTRVPVIGVVTLPVVLGDQEPRVSKQVEFTIVDCKSPHNGIFGRPLLAKFMALPSTCHQKLKFPTKEGSGEACGTAWEPTKTGEIRQTNIVDTRAEEPRPESMDSDFEVALDPSEPTHKVRVSTHVPGDAIEPLIKLLKEYKELFAWCTEDMSGVPRDVAQHSLGVPVSATPRQQARRSFTGDKLKAIEEEVARLLSAGLIRPVKYPKWLANVVLVKKSSGAWRMCVDYTTINKVCPGDPYPLPRIDQLIDATADHETLSFLDMFSGYHQIPMSREDEEKTAFMTPFGNFCFVGMPFGLKNAGATYQRMIDTVFAQQRGRNIEAYVDDLIVKTKAGKSHLDDLRETFESAPQTQSPLEPAEMRVRSGSRKILGIHDHQARHRSRPKANHRSPRLARAKKHIGDSVPERENCGARKVHPKVS